MMISRRTPLILSRDFPCIVAVDRKTRSQAHIWCLKRLGGDAYWRLDYTNTSRNTSHAFWTSFNSIFYFKQPTTTVIEFKLNFG